MDPISFPTGAIFSINRAGEGDSGIYLGSLDAKPEQQSSKRLLAGGSNAAYAPASDPDSSTGHLLFTREGSLMAQAFDLRRLELAGEAVPIAEGMGSGAPRPFSASTTGVLAYRTGAFTGSAETDHATYLVRSGREAAGNRRRAGRVQLQWRFRAMEPASRSAVLATKPDADRAGVRSRYLGA